jgi:nucleotidyltransferase/DNA polymerase involved in DNA repair
MAQSILDVRGIGPAMQVTLAKNGFKTIEDLASTSVEQLSVTPGISELKATQVINDARNLLAPIIPDEKAAKVKTKDKKKSKKAEDKNKKKAKDETKDKKKNKKKNKDKKSKKSKKSKK